MMLVIIMEALASGLCGSISVITFYNDCVFVVIYHIFTPFYLRYYARLCA